MTFSPDLLNIDEITIKALGWRSVALYQKDEINFICAKIQRVPNLDVESMKADLNFIECSTRNVKY